MINKTSSFDQLSCNFGVAQENKLYIQGIKMKDDESEWLQANDCIVCDLHFSKCGKAHHWVCGNPVCKACSNKIINDKRSCDLCFKRIQMVDQEKLKKQQIKTKKEAIKELKIQIQKQQEKNDTMKSQIIELQKQFERQESDHISQEKTLQDQFEQKINTIRQQIENNKRLEQNIKGEQTQLEELEQETAEINNQIEKKRFDIIFGKGQNVKQNENLQKQEKNLQDLKQNFDKKQQEKIQFQEKQEKSESQISTNQSKNEDLEQRSTQVKKKDQKEKENCIIY